MPRQFFPFFLSILVIGPAYPRQDQAICGTYPDKWKEVQHLHRMSRRTIRPKSALQTGAAPREASRNIGNVVVLSDADGVVARLNQFNLDRRTVVFTPLNQAASRYRFDTANDTYEEIAATNGRTVNGLDDDDTRRISLPFAFPFFGHTYSDIWVNSDGNVTFGSGDAASADRSIGRLIAGPPRIAALFRDLDPTRVADSVRITSDSGRFVVSWVRAPEYAEFGAGVQQTFQLRLYTSGKIELVYAGITTKEAVVGISPGTLQGSSTIVSFATTESGEYTSTIAERFTSSNEVDVTAAAQKFYQDHEDAYDYLVFYNTLGVQAGTSAVAWESTVRNQRSGYGDEVIDVGAGYGSAARLQSVINMGQLTQYPSDPNGIVSKRAAAGDTPLTVLAHEAGHLFLAFASIRDPGDPLARPMLDRQGHWNFGFNSEASLLEGNRIEDRGPTVSPRFRTTATVEGYAPLDQYLMGFRAPEEVPPTFLARTFSTWRMPQAGVEFDGERRDVTVQDLILADGRRTPDHTVAQRRFRFAIILIVPDGTEPTAEQVAQVERYRSAFEPFFARAAGDRAAAETSLGRNLRLSVFPAAGLVSGQRAQGTVSIERPATADLSVALEAGAGNVRVPGSVRIPAGATSAAVELVAIRPGVDEIRAQALDAGFASVTAKVQVSAASALRLVLESGDRQAITPGQPLEQPVVFRVTDQNNLPYPGLTLLITPSAGGVVSPVAPATDVNGRASVRWTPGDVATGQLSVTISGISQSPAAIATASRPGTVTATSVLNAASFDGSLAPGAIASVYGSNLSTGGTLTAPLPWPDSLAGVRILLNGRSVPVLFVSDRQVNFLVPSETPEGSAELVVATALASSAPLRVSIGAVAPGIFFDSVTGYGAILNAGTSLTTFLRPARRGAVVEVYCTGLGAVGGEVRSALRETSARPEASIDNVRADVLYSGLAPGYLGLYQVNVLVPADLPVGVHSISLTVNGARSNAVRMAVQE